MSIYHYTTFDSFVKIWLSKTLLFNEYKNMNDIYEKRKFCRIEIPQGKSLPNEINYTINFVFQQLSRFRQISFCQDYHDIKGCLSPMMWGQYAKNEKGVCIEFDKEKILLECDNKNCFSDEVVYDDKIPHLTTDSSDFYGDIDTVEKNIKKIIIDNKEKIFFSKHTHWRPENEYRIISDTENTLSIENAIACVYIQNPDSLVARLLKLLIKDIIPIKYINYMSNNGNVDLSIEELSDE